MIKAIIFDCFGVIVTDALAPVFARLRQEDASKAQALADLLNAGSRGLITPEESLRDAAQLVGVPQQEYRQLLIDGEVKDQRLLEYIRKLRRSYKTAILSNVSKGGLRRRFSREELDTYFDFVVASGDVGFAKPEAQAYEYVARGLGVRLDECVFLDDIEEYCLAARSVGMGAIRYQGFEQAKAELEKLLDDSKG